MTPVSERFLVVAATRAETTHLPPDLPLVVTGIGKTMAAVATARALAADPDRLAAMGAAAAALIPRDADEALARVVLESASGTTR